MIVVAALTWPSALTSRASASEAGVGGQVGRAFEITYSFTVRQIPAGAKHVIVWVPVPSSNAQQHLENLRVHGERRYAVLIEPEYGNRFIRFELTGAVPAGEGDGTATVTFRVTRKPYQTPAAAGLAPAASQANLASFLAPDRLIPIDGKIAEEARRVAGDLEAPFARAKRLYDHIVNSMTYDKTGKGWGRGDALYACDVRKGNCTDFHSLFIGEARALGIPARFIMGLPLPEGEREGIIPGYHCWAEFYVEGKGWLPVDASEASKFPDKKETYFCQLDANRVQFTTGRDIRLPLSETGPVNYSIYPHVEVDGKVHRQVQTQFRWRDLGDSPPEARRGVRGPGSA